ncbi:hypothetical protein [Sodalis-like endosymbiont of Proechinophthirus fluctus]|nr:hypothetical protein [Sodalis-like endosymbiont of Proechinophthirus fluctus]
MFFANFIAITCLLGLCQFMLPLRQFAFLVSKVALSVCLQLLIAAM